jgi:hypothetical protein
MTNDQRHIDHLDGKSQPDPIEAEGPTSETRTRNPRNRVFGYLSPNGELVYETLGSNPSRSYRASKRLKLSEDHVLWEFVMTRQVRHDDVSTIARRLLQKDFR